MTDIAAPFGLRKIRGKSSIDTSAGGRTAYKAAAPAATRLVKGELAKLVPGGVVSKETGTTTALPIGVFDGFEYTDVNGKYQWSTECPSGTTADASDIVAYVADDQDSVFEIQANGTLGQNCVGMNAALVQNAAGVFGQAKVALNAGSIAATATLPLRIVGIDADQVGTAYPIVQVVLNTHAFKTATGNAAS
jgi:hypothetical protein